MKMKKRLLSIPLTLALVLSLMPGISLTAYAATETYTALKNNATVVHFHNYDWYIIADDSTSATEGTVTLLSADESFGMSVFNSEANNSYNASAVKAYLDNVVAGNAGVGKPDFSDVADAIEPVDLTTYNYNSTTDVKETTGGAKLYLLDTAAANNLNSTIKSDKFEGAEYGCWWLRSPGMDSKLAAYVLGKDGYVERTGNNVIAQFGVRPALKLDLSKVTFDSTSNTFSVVVWISGDCTVTYDTDTNTVTVKKTDASSAKGNMADYGMDAYGDVPPSPWNDIKDNFQNIVIEDGVTGIGNNTFINCGSIKNITIPASVTNIGENAFYTSEPDRRVIFIRPKSESSLTVANHAFYYSATLAYSDGGNYSLFAGDSKIELSGSNNGEKLNGKTLTWKLTISPKTVEPENPVEKEKTVPMYRLFNKGTLEHLYTDSKREREVLSGSGWIYEGIAWYAPEKSTTPVYRLYNPILKDHHYTIDAYERDVLSTKHGWIYEGIGWYSDDAKTVPIYRRFYPFITSGSHHYTNSLNEVKHLVKVGWIDEGIGWYGAAEK